MKIRTDFITNSSSSSFIIGYNSEEELRQVLMVELPPKYVNDVFLDIISNKENVDSALDYCIDALKRRAENDVMESLEDGIGFDTAWDFQEKHPEDFQEMVKVRENDLIEECRAKASHYSQFSVVEYADDSYDGCALEHEIMPKFSRTIGIVSHH